MYLRFRGMVSSGSQYICYFLEPWTINLEELYRTRFQIKFQPNKSSNSKHGKNLPCGFHTYLILSEATAFSFAALRSSRSLTLSEYGIFMFFWLPIYTKRNEQNDEMCKDNISIAYYSMKRKHNVAQFWTQVGSCVENGSVFTVCTTYP